MTVLYVVSSGDMYSYDGDAEEPEWVKTEREQFVEFRDKNHDGKMDKEETKDWILPSDYDHAEAEARHLVYESDQNKVRGGGLSLVPGDLVTPLSWVIELAAV